jgi:hypothetical protein
MTDDQNDNPAVAEFVMTDDRRVGHVSTVHPTSQNWVGCDELIRITS